ncbi:carbohydrate ABC transporter permease [Actinoplanes xinjiangensis]|uniref:Carbohydrate ABC transporter membrane protein 1 (CUT1 family) n=1 Tax=Actinoplanes xinjiangensis TaxID=512350 RepID=A0A316FLT4_9ACTN|nr:sugar ABC transporter permease [Actinoplanes xinjiangensis]PWK48680.1 carbohydrate ABC transporter membrane protein 1 (CUT1 family) [Actinoplanes xinjiangensis]GIF38384.1 ABC transporter permease [Actinoplanes xinjiangensis]
MTRRSWIGWQFTGPFLAVFALVFLAPIGYSAYLSVFRTRLVGGTSFVGLENYTKALSDPQFWEALTRVGLFLLIQVPIMLGLALLVALAIDSGRLYGAGFFRVAIFLPYAVPSVVATLMAGFLYGIRFGLVGSINETFGLSLPDPLGPSWILVTIGNIVTWQYVGYNMLILYSGLKVIDNALYEAAAIDGASEFRIIRAIKLPALRGPLVVAGIFSIVGSFQLFNEPQVLDSLAPNSVTTYFTPNIYAYQLSFAGQQVNYSATIALLMGVSTMIVAYLFQLRTMRGSL